MTTQPKGRQRRQEQAQRRRDRKEARTRAAELMTAIKGFAAKLSDQVQPHFWRTLNRLTSEMASDAPKNPKPDYAIEAGLRFEEEMADTGDTPAEVEAATAFHSVVQDAGIGNARVIFAQGYIVGAIEQERNQGG